MSSDDQSLALDAVTYFLRGRRSKIYAVPASGSGPQIDVDTMSEWCRSQDVEALRAHIAKLEKDLAEQERGECRTIQDRDDANDRIQSIHVALGGDGEWVGTRDLGAEAEAMAEELEARVAELETLLREVERSRSSHVDLASVCETWFERRDATLGATKEMDAESLSVPGAGSEQDLLLNRAQNAEFCLGDEKRRRADAEFLLGLWRERAFYACAGRVPTPARPSETPVDPTALDDLSEWAKALEEQRDAARAEAEELRGLLVLLSGACSRFFSAGAGSWRPNENGGRMAFHTSRGAWDDLMDVRRTVAKAMEPQSPAPTPAPPTPRP